MPALLAAHSNSATKGCCNKTQPDRVRGGLFHNYTRTVLLQANRGCCVSGERKKDPSIHPSSMAVILPSGSYLALDVSQLSGLPVSPTYKSLDGVREKEELSICREPAAKDVK